jgi:hypothetical protein
MKLSSVTVLTLSLAFVSSGASSSLRAQEASATSISDEVAQCVKWMQATVPGLRPPNDGDLRKLDPAHFCSGIEEGGLNGWGSVLLKCGKPAEQLSGMAPRYCTSSGEIYAGHAWAAGFRSTTKRGSDLLDGKSGAVSDSQHAVTFYSASSVWMEDLRLPAGMYKLIPSKSPDGWKLAVAKQDGESSDAEHAQQYLGSLAMKAAPRDATSEQTNLGISVRRGGERCPGPSPRRDIGELHFIYGSTDLFVCLRPNQVLQRQEADISQR